jgi:hypothetical protein
MSSVYERTQARKKPQSLPVDEERAGRTSGGAGIAFWPGCCTALWLVLVATLAVSIVALLLIALNLHRFKPLEDCCASSLSQSQSLDEGQHFAVCNSESGVIGVTNTSDYTLDECNGLMQVMTRFIKPMSLTKADSLVVCAQVGGIDDPAPEFSVAIFADDGFGVPTRVLGNSSTEALVGNDLNCQNVTADLSETLYFWLAFMTSGSTCDVTNNLYYAPHTALRGAQRTDFVFPVWTDVTTSSAIDYVSYVYGMQVSYQATCVGPA